MAGWGKKYEAAATEWREGVHAAAAKDLIPMDASPQAYNAAWEHVGDDTATIRARRGPYLDVTDQVGTTTTPVTVVAQAFYSYWDATAEEYTDYHLAFGEGGQIVKHNSDQSLTVYSTAKVLGNPAAVLGSTANNRFYLSFGVPVKVGAVQSNGVIFDGTSWYPFIATPASTPAATATGSGDMTGDYEVAISYYNATRGHETSRTAEVDVTAASQKIRVTWIAPSDPSVSHVRVHLRKGTISKDFYQAASIAVGTNTTDLDISDTEYNALITKSPSETDHEAPPTGTKQFVWHRGRLFAVTDGKLYYSKSTSDIEGFDNTATEEVNPDDGQKIVTAISIFDKLVVLKEASVWALEGDGPNDWEIRNVSKSTGTRSAASLVVAEGILYWWGKHGPVAWTGEGEPVALGTGMIRDLLLPTELNYSNLNQVQGALDENNERILWAVPAMGSLRNNLVLPYKYSLKRFEGKWETIDIASWCVGEDSVGNPVVWCGDYDGRIYKWWASDADGLPNDGGTYAGVAEATATTMTVITDAVTPFALDTDLGGVAGLYATIISSTGKSYPRRRIASNTAQSITLESAITGLTVGEDLYIYIGGIDFQFDTKWQDDGLPFHKKRYEFLYVEVQAPASTTLWVDLSYDKDDVTLHTNDYTITPGTTGGIWDTGEWDDAAWGTVATTRKRIRVAHCGHTWRARIRHLADRIPFSLLKVGMRGEVLTDKR